MIGMQPEQVIGFTPDVFMGPLMGVLLDNSPGVLGHQHVFAVVAGFGLVGFVATGAFLLVGIEQFGRRKSLMFGAFGMGTFFFIIGALGVWLAFAGNAGVE